MTQESNKNVFVFDGKSISIFGDHENIEQCVVDLYNEEYDISSFENKSIKEEVIQTIHDLGFEWDPLSEKGYMRFRPYAVSMMEAMKQYIWNLVSGFCNKIDIPFQKIEGGELYSMNNPNINKHTALATASMMYGENMLMVTGGASEQILRFSGCCNKLGMLQSKKIKCSDLPLGIFEISKSYRFEKKERLNYCERVRCFHLPELHIVTTGLDESIKIILSAHEYIIEHLRGLGYDFVLMCSATEEFINNNIDFIQTLNQSNNHQMMIILTSSGDVCENGIQFDVEYKAITSYGGFMEIATLQVDAGDSDFAYGITYDDKPISTIHAVLFASIERAIYSIIDRCIYNKMNNKSYSLPAWISPVQCRIIVKDNNSILEAINLRVELASRCIRCEIDDREIPYDKKINDKIINLCPIVIIVDSKDNKKYQIYNPISNKSLNCLKDNILEYAIIHLNTNGIIAPFYSTYRLSNRIL